MQMAKKRKTKLSPIASKIAGLVNDLADGNNSKFAHMAGCSQSVISRVVRGEKEPGASLLKRIGAIEGVDVKELFDLAQDQLRKTVSTFVPIAMGLLPGTPRANPSLLTNQSVEVPAGLFTWSLYALPAEKCQSLFDTDANLNPSDLLVIETDTSGFKNSIRSFDGKHCVVMEKGSGPNGMTLCKVSCSQGAKNKWQLFAELPIKRSSRRERDQRPIQIPGVTDGNEPEQPVEPKAPHLSDQMIRYTQIRGFVVISMRYF